MRRLLVAMLLALALMGPAPTVFAAYPTCSPTEDNIMFAIYDGDDPTSSSWLDYGCSNRTENLPLPNYWEDWFFGNNAGPMNVAGTNDRAESVAFRGRSGQKWCMTIFEDAGPGGDQQQWTYSTTHATVKVVNLQASFDNLASAFHMWRASSLTAACLPHTYTWHSGT